MHILIIITYTYKSCEKDSIDYEPKCIKAHGVCEVSAQQKCYDYCKATIVGTEEDGCLRMALVLHMWVMEEGLFGGLLNFG